MAKCGKFLYELIETLGLSDLRSNIILAATIVSIDRVNNTATVTYDTHADPALPTQNIEFFYHCEFSDGTLDDLMFGNLAFGVDDLVYVVNLPATGETASRLYIVGHRNLRLTIPCINEILEIRQDDFVTLIDIGKQQVFNIKDFEERLEILPADSTAPPEYDCVRNGVSVKCRFPCAFNLAYETWRDSYFELSIAYPMTLLENLSHYTPYGYTKTVVDVSVGTTTTWSTAGWDVPPNAWDWDVIYSYENIIDSEITDQYGVLYYTHNWDDKHSGWSSRPGYAATNYGPPLDITESVLFDKTLIYSVESAVSGKRYGISIDREASLHFLQTGNWTELTPFEFSSNIQFFKKGIFSISDIVENANPIPMLSYGSALTNNTLHGLQGLSYTGDILFDTGAAGFAVNEYIGFRYTAGIGGLLYDWTYIPSDVGIKARGKNFFYFVDGLYGEVGTYDFSNDSSGITVVLDQNWGNTPYLAYVDTAEIISRIVTDIVVIPFCTATMYMKMKTVNFANPVLIDDFFDYADVQISSVIDTELINLVKYVYVNEGIGSANNGAGKKPSLAVFALKEEYVL